MSKPQRDRPVEPLRKINPPGDLNKGNKPFGAPTPRPHPRPAPQNPNPDKPSKDDGGKR